MPAATPIPKLAALLVMVTAVALVSHEVSAISANTTEAHKSMSASAMLVSRDTDADPKYDMHSLRTGDTTRAEAAEERTFSFENFRNTVSSWVERIMLKFLPYYEQLHSVRINSAIDGLHPSPSVIESENADKSFLKRYQAQDMYHPSLIVMTESLVHLDESKLMEKELQYLKSLFEKEPFFDVAKEDTVFIALATLKKTAYDHVQNMYIERDNAIVQRFPDWKNEDKSSVTELLKSEFTTSDEVAKGYQLKYDSYRHNMATLPGGRLDDSMDAPHQIKWLVDNQPFPDLARTLFSPGLSEDQVKKATSTFNYWYNLQQIEIQSSFKLKIFGYVATALENAEYPPLVARLYKLKYESYRNMWEKAFADDRNLKVFIQFQKLMDTVKFSDLQVLIGGLDAVEETALQAVKTEMSELAPHIKEVAKL